MSFTAAPGTIAPEGSLTTPVSPANIDCACNCRAGSVRKASPTSDRSELFIPWFLTHFRSRLGGVGFGLKVEASNIDHLQQFSMDREFRHKHESEERDDDLLHARALNDSLFIGNAPTKLISFLTHHARSEEHTSELQSRLHLVCR